MGGCSMTKTRRYQIASGWVLIEEIPDNFFDLEEQKQDRFLINNVSEDYQNYDAKGLWEVIEGMEGFIRYAIKEEVGYETN
jgi:hypothetical protein